MSKLLQPQQAINSRIRLTVTKLEEIKTVWTQQGLIHAVFHTGKFASLISCSYQLWLRLVWSLGNNRDKYEHKHPPSKAGLHRKDFFIHYWVMGVKCMPQCCCIFNLAGKTGACSNVKQDLQSQHLSRGHWGTPTFFLCREWRTGFRTKPGVDRKQKERMREVVDALEIETNLQHRVQDTRKPHHAHTVTVVIIR